MARQLSLALLGTFQVQLDQDPVTEFGYDKVRALLAYLAVEAGAPQRRDTLTALLWPEQMDSVARKSLNQALYTLRKVLGDVGSDTPFLLADRTAIQLNPAADIGLDTQTFQIHVAAAINHRHVNPTTCVSCAAEWRQAASLYRGEFLQGLSISGSPGFDEWLALTREQLHRPAMQALATLTQYHTWRGEWEEALGYARRWASLEPWQEEAQQRTILLLARTGEFNAAIAQYENCRAILLDELGLEPTPETSALFERIQRARKRVTRHNLPPQPTGFIGREQELAQLRRLLAHPERRLITLVGPGGIGKTRLATETAREQATAFLEGVVFVSLAAVESGKAFASTLAATLELHLQARESSSKQIINYLRGRELLLVLDNFEQLIDEMDLLVEIFAQVPSVKVIVTSRERLKLHGEWVVDLAGLDYPPQGEEAAIEDYSAPRLFARSASRVRTNFSLRANKGEVARICRLVEGMPLALEMSAAWVNTFTPAKIAAEIEQGLDLLAIEAPNLPPRHRSMRAAFDTSWQRLDAYTQQVFAKLSVFRNGFTQEAARQIIEPQMNDLAFQLFLSELSVKCLIRYDPESERYDLHELIRQFVKEKLVAFSSEGLRDKHLNYFTHFAERLAPHLHYGNQIETMKQLEPDYANFQAALTWSIKNTAQAHLGLRLAISIDEFWAAKGLVREGHNWLTKLIRLTEDTISLEVRAHTLLIVAEYEMSFRQDDLAYKFLKESLLLCRKFKDEALLARALTNMGRLERRRKNWTAAQAYYEESLSTTHEKSGHTYTLQELAKLASRRQDWVKAKAYLKETMHLYQELDDSIGKASVHVSLGRIAIQEQNLASAKQHFVEARKIYQESRIFRGVSKASSLLGELARLEGDYQNAILYYRASLDFFEESGLTYFAAQSTLNLGLTLIQLGDERQATEKICQSLIQFQKLEKVAEVAYCLSGLGGIAAAWMQPDRAARLLGASDMFLTTTNTKLELPDSKEFNSFIENTRIQLSSAAFDTAWNEGQQMSLERAIAYALETIESSL